MTAITSISRYFLVAVTLLLAVGCASKPVEPTLGDVMRANSEQAQRQSEAKKELAREWERGAKLVADGEKLVSRGEARVEDAEAAIEKGTDEIEQGTEKIVAGEELKARSERLFRERYPDVTLAPVVSDR